MPEKSPSIVLAALVYVVLGTVLALATPSPTGGQDPMAILLSCVSCLFVIAAGMIAVWHYTGTHQLTLPAGQGVTLGMSAATLGTITAALIGFALIAMGMRPGMEEAIELTIQELEASGMTDDQIDSAVSVTRMMMSPVALLIMAALSGIIGGAIGGALGAIIFKKGPTTDEI